MSLSVHPREIVAASDNPLLAVHPSWPRVEVGEVADILNGAAFRSEFFTKNGTGVPLLRIRDVGGDGSTDAHYDGEYEDRYIVRKGDLVIGMDGDFRIAPWDGPDALLNQRVCKVTVRDPQRYDSRFLLHVLQGYLDAIHEVTSSVTVKHLSSRTVAQIPVPDPPFDEQRRIVEAIETHLSHLDAGVKSLHRAQRNLGRMRTAAIAAEFSMDWPTRTLADVAEWGSGGTPRSTVPAYYDGEIPWAVIGDLNDDLVTRTARSITKVGLANSSAKLVAPGTLLIAMYGSIGKLGVVGEAMATNQAIAFARACEEVVIPAYLFWYLRSQRGALVASGRGATQSNISQTLLKAWPIPVPPLDDQTQAVDRIEAQMARVDALQNSLSTTNLRVIGLRRKVLECAFAGTLITSGQPPVRVGG